MLALENLKNELLLTMNAMASGRPQQCEDEIINAVCSALKVDYIDLTTGNRSDENAEARYIIFKLLKEHTPLRYKHIAVLFNRDCSTVVHGVRRFRELYESRDKRFLGKIGKVSVQLPGIDLIERNAYG